jgi:hypothetical protein
MVKTPGAGNEKGSVFNLCALTQCEKMTGRASEDQHG